jgi:DNA-binding NtrC family response regulator
MRQIQRILVVHEDAVTAARLAARLETAGYWAETATNYEDGKTLMAITPPALLIASVRLGAYNGLHLVIRGRFDYPGMAAILISDVPNPTFEAEAARHGAGFVVGPPDNQKLLSLIAEALDSDAV